MPTPDSVPPVPTEQTNASTVPRFAPKSRDRSSRNDRAGWRGCRIDWPRSRRSAPARQSPRRAARNSGHSALDSRKAPPAPAADRRRKGAACPFFLALRLGHDDDRAVAAGVADQRQADPGIAGGALDDDAARPQQTALLGVLDDKKRGTVLDRASGVQELGLAEDRAAGLFRSVARLDQRGVADAADEPVADIHNSPPRQRSICAAF